MCIFYIFRTFFPLFFSGVIFLYFSPRMYNGGYFITVPHTADLLCTVEEKRKAIKIWIKNTHTEGK